MQSQFRVFVPVLLAALALAGCKPLDSGSSSSDDSETGPGSGPGTDPGTTAPIQLRREGRHLVDPHNRIVLLHGVNTIWKRAPFVPPNSPEGFRPVDAQWISDHGFNAARVGTLWVGVMPDEPGKIDANYLSQWDRVVQLLAAQKIWMMFDFHQDMMSPEYQGQGVPDWAVELLKGPVNSLPPPMFGFPFNYFSPQVSELFDNLYAERGVVWDGFRDAWKAVAAKWKNQSYHMGYDLMNEPWAGQEWPQCLLVGGTGQGGCPNSDRDEIQPFLDHARKGIRQVDAANLVWFEPQLLSGGTALPTGFVPVPGESQLGYSFHNYCPHAALLQSLALPAGPIPVDPSSTCASFISGVIEQGHAAGERMGAVAAMTEFGASDDLTIIRDTTAAADANFTSWFYWHYKNWADPTTQSQESGAQGLFTDDTDFNTVKLEKLKLLERTYPQATAGVPVSLSFNPDTAEFSYSYTPRVATAPTEIYVPVALHYPQGYRVTVTGATVASLPNSPRLVLQNTAGATEVSVMVVRR